MFDIVIYLVRKLTLAFNAAANDFVDVWPDKGQKAINSVPKLVFKHIKSRILPALFTKKIVNGDYLYVIYKVTSIRIKFFIQRIHTRFEILALK